MTHSHASQALEFRRRNSTGFQTECFSTVSRLSIADAEQLPGPIHVGGTECCPWRAESLNPVLSDNVQRKKDAILLRTENERYVEVEFDGTQAGEEVSFKNGRGLRSRLGN
jgi:hypothetical protein